MDLRRSALCFAVFVGVTVPGWGMDDRARPAVQEAPGGSSRAEVQFGQHRIFNGTSYAVLGETWTFDHSPGDPAEGWEVIDISSGQDGVFWRRITDELWAGHGNDVPAPIIAGEGSAWCGVYEDSADVLCYLGGLGYGNDWLQYYVSPELTYDGDGDIDISFQYWCDLEGAYDFARVYLEEDGQDRTLIDSFTGVLGDPSTSQFETYAGTISGTSFTGAGFFRIVFALETDVGYSDEDGDYTTVYGPFAFDNLQLANNIVEGDQLYDFEVDAHGFVADQPEEYGAAMDFQTVDYYQEIMGPDSLNYDPPPADCGPLADYVMALLDDNGDAEPHTQGQLVRALSPIADLYGISGEEGIRAEWDYYANLPYADGVMLRPGWVYYPVICPETGLPMWSDRVGMYNWIYTGGPTCLHGNVDGTASVPVGDLPDDARYVRFVLDLVADCDRFGVPNCTNSSNLTPLIDNLAIYVSGAGLSVPWGACCVAETGECYNFREATCQTVGGTWHEGETCNTTLCPVPTEPEVAAGGWIHPEPWHDWISDYGEDEGVRIEAYIPDQMGEIEHVEFYYSTDGGSSWEFIADDADGTEPALNTIDDSVQMIGCGWSTFFDIPDTLAAGPIQIKSVAYPVSGTPFEDVVERVHDPLPPSMGRVNLTDFVVVDRDALGFEVTTEATEIERIIVHRQRLEEEFTKGIPGISQQSHSETHCAPTAAAQCLKYFEQKGDLTVAHGLDDFRLTGALAAYMSTNETVAGTLPSQWVGGLGEWIDAYGEGYTIRYFVHYECDLGFSNWSAEKDWTRIRNELALCHDVLVGVFWDAGGGHAITLDSILHPALPNGRYLVGYKDPWTGASEAGELDPETGHFTSMSGAGGGGGGTIGVTMIVTPAEASVAAGGPGEPVYDGLPEGPPYEIEIPIPEEGFWYIHITIVNTSGHAHRITRIVERNDQAAVDTEEEVRPFAYDLRPCRPNPFHQQTRVSFALPRRGGVRLTIHDVTGRLVRTLQNGELDPGVYEVVWDGRDQRRRRVSSGIYYVKMQTEEFDRARKIMILR